ncbi:arylsulfotransferase family protein [Agriterribacter humi]|uniref:arylsulfotransferase family protein n=1 Tax=Agriterribacter humi TaxID=1104781 RepID=UPI001264F810|nr:aryl-sulfate sulfotransferase [Agriterribacter humi]
MKKIFVLITCLVLVIAAVLIYLNHSVSITSIELSSPGNIAMNEAVKIVLDKEEQVFVRYWKEGAAEKLRTPLTATAKEHDVRLLLLDPNTVYHYQVIIDKLIDVASKEMTFRTREQSPWLVHNWVRGNAPHDAAALDGGMVMLCNARLPGYIAMVDGKGSVKWYWQIDDIGVRAATLTPRGTLLAMLRPPVRDVIDDTPKAEADSLREVAKPIRRGAMGFAGGTAIAEIDLTGKMLWRINMDTVDGGKHKVIHHDVRMDRNGNIVVLTRNQKPFDMAKLGGAGIDTLGGDGILVMDNKGKKIWEWNVWNEWDTDHDPLLKEFAYDRFHMNSLNFDKDNNYLVSVAIEDQIWKVNKETGKIMWKLGKNGNFKMDTAYHFSFQHSVHINPYGDLMVFDNSLWKKQSGAVSFQLDTVKWTATPKIHAMLPASKYTSRMGSAYVLPNNNLLQCSSKTGAVMVTDQQGKIRWELNCYFVPYRAEYIAPSVWTKYFVKE